MTASASADPTFNVPWRVRDAVMAVVGANLAMAALLMFLGIFFGAVFVAQGVSVDYLRFFEELFRRPPGFELLLLIQVLLMALFMSRCMFRPHRFDPRTLFVPGQAAQDVRQAIRFFLQCFAVTAAVVVGIILAVAVWGLFLQRDPAGAIQTYATGVQQEGQRVFTIGREGSAAPVFDWLRVAIVALLAPPIEELLFRGGLYGALRKRFRPWPANLLTSGLFALSHGYVFALPNVLVLGIVSTYAYERTRSLRTPILLHVLWNTLGATRTEPILWLVLPASLLLLWRWARRAVR